MEIVNAKQTKTIVGREAEVNTDFTVTILYGGHTYVMGVNVEEGGVDIEQVDGAPPMNVDEEVQLDLTGVAKDVADALAKAMYI